jgi:type VI secretion system secreted protein VgrG
LRYSWRINTNGVANSYRITLKQFTVAMNDLSALVQGSSFLQNRRLLSLSFPHDDAPSATDAYGRSRTVTLVVERLAAHEGLGIDFRIELTLLGNDAGIALNDMLGKMMVVSLVRPDGGARYFSGYCTEFSLAGSDGSIAEYRAVLRPWSEFLRARVNDRLFLGQTLQQQITTILVDYQSLAPVWMWRVRGDDPVRARDAGAGGLRRCRD